MPAPVGGHQANTLFIVMKRDGHVYHALLAALAFAAPLVGLFETLRNKSERFLRPEGKRNYAKHPEFRSQASAQDQQ